jgi:hypothetical protein
MKPDAPRARSESRAAPVGQRHDARGPSPLHRGEGGVRGAARGLTLTVQALVDHLERGA